MTNSIIAKVQDFRRHLYSLFQYRADAIFDLIDAIAAGGYDSIVKTSLSPLFRREYSSITDAADNLFRLYPEVNPSEQELKEQQLKISQLSVNFRSST